MVSKLAIAGLLGLALLVAVVVMNPSLLQQASLDDTVILGTGEDPNASKLQQYQGPVDVNMKVSDSLEQSTVYTDGTEADINYYKLVNDQPVFITASTSNTAPIDVDESLTTIWAEVVVPSGQAFYVDAVGITQAHNRVGNPIICDYNVDNIDTYCFPIDLTGFQKGDQDPGFTWFVRLFDEGSITINSPADISALGQGKAQCRINWEASFVTSEEGDAEFMTKAQLIANQTDDDMWFENESWVKLNGVTFGLGDEIPGDEKASTFEYEVKLANDYLREGVVPLKYPINGQNEYDFEAKIFTNFDANDEGIEWTLHLITENAQGAITDLSDAVKCLEA